jgi:hypothetical protein
MVFSPSFPLVLEAIARAVAFYFSKLADDFSNAGRRTFS